MQKIIYNGRLIPAGEKIAGADNRGLRYGDGLFETMKMVNGKIALPDYHFERLFSGLHLLKFSVPKSFAKEKLAEEIMQLCKQNKCGQLARIRLMVFRGDGGLYDFAADGFNYVIQCRPLKENIMQLNENGLSLGVCPDIRKSCDAFANLKSANFLPYVMAAVYAKENEWDECLVLNEKGCIADATIANLFIIKNETFITPPLTEGCIAGVMRRFLIGQLPAHGYDFKEKELTATDLHEANEIFLTNAAYGIRWVGRFEDKTYSNDVSTGLFEKFISPFYS